VTILFHCLAAPGNRNVHEKSRTYLTAA